MKLVGTIIEEPTKPRTVPVKRGNTTIEKTIRECAVFDADGGVVTLQQWNEPGEDSNPFGDLHKGDRIEAVILNPDQYQGVTRCGVASLTKTA